MTFCQAAALCGCLFSVPALSADVGEHLYDAADDRPAAVVRQDGRDWCRVSVQAGSSAVHLGGGKVLLPEFETAEIVCEFRAADGIVPTGGGLEVLTFPGNIPAYVRGKTVRFSVSGVRRISNGIYELRIPVSAMVIAEKSGGAAFPSRLNDLWVTRGESAAGSVDVGKISIVRKGFFADLSVGNGRLMVGDLGCTERNDPHFTLVNAGEAGERRFAWEVFDEDGKSRRKGTVARTFAAGERVRVDLPRLKKAAVLDVVYTIGSAETNGWRHTRRLAYGAMHPTGPAPKLFSDDFHSSVCVHAFFYPMDEVRTMVDYLAEAGTDLSRGGANGYWCGNEPEPGRWNTAREDKIRRLFMARNIETHGDLMCPPKWAIDPVLTKTVTGLGYPKLDLYEKYCEEEVRRLKGEVRFFEDANEPNLQGWTAERFAAYEKACYRGLKKGNPDAILLSGEWGGLTGGWVADYYLKHNPDMADVQAHHYHGGYLTSCYNVKTIVDKLEELRRRGGKATRWFADECALGSTDTRAMSRVYMQKYVYARAHGAIGYTWYNLRNKGYYLPPKSGEVIYGLLTHDLCPRAPYLTHNMLCGTYRAARYVAPVAVTNDVECWRFETGRAVLLPLWTFSDTQGTKAATFGTDAVRAELVDVHGNVTAVPVEKGRVTAPVRQTPATLRLFPATATAVCVGTEGDPAPTFTVPKDKDYDAFTPYLKDMHYTSFVQGIPEKQFLYWTGTHDLAIWHVGFYRPNGPDFNFRIAYSDDCDVPPSDLDRPERGDSVTYLFAFPRQKGLWEIRIARDAKGAALFRVCRAPEGCDAAAVAARGKAGWGIDKVGTRWPSFRCPFAALGTDARTVGEEGYRFNVVVRDDDGPECEGYMSLVPGDPRNLEVFPHVTFEK